MNTQFIRSARAAKVFDVLKWAFVLTVGIVSFQNCSQPGSIQTQAASNSLALSDAENQEAVPIPADTSGNTTQNTVNPGVPNVSACRDTAGQVVACSQDPITSKPATSTILLTLSDSVDGHSVVGNSSAEYLAEMVIRYTSPAQPGNLKILVVKDTHVANEGANEIEYIQKTLLRRYTSSFLQAPEGGLTLEMLKIPGTARFYDVIWFTNPGYPLSSSQTLKVLSQFPNGIVLEGDDMSHGLEGDDGHNNGHFFDLSALTGLAYHNYHRPGIYDPESIQNGVLPNERIQNGEVIVCNGKQFNTPQNSPRYHVSLVASQFPALDLDALKFDYINDIDISVAANPAKVRVLAEAATGIDGCQQTRPVIVNYVR